MNERINIIKEGFVTIQYGNGFQDGIKASVRSFRISRSENDAVTIHLDGEIIFRTKIYLVTIQQQFSVKFSNFFILVIYS